jgi:hypothetical protein
VSGLFPAGTKGGPQAMGPWGSGPFTMGPRSQSLASGSKSASWQQLGICPSPGTDNLHGGCIRDSDSIIAEVLNSKIAKMEHI